MVKNNKKIVPLAIVACLSVFALMAKDGYSKRKNRSNASDTTTAQKQHEGETRGANRGSDRKEENNKAESKKKRAKKDQKRRSGRKNRKNKSTQS